LDLESGREIGEFWGFDRVWLECESEEESLEDIEKNALKSLCGDLLEEIFDESSFLLNSELDNFSFKGKSHANSCLRKTCKMRTMKFSKRGAK
jgi:hypothetical protein